jgi:MOSC domain-containing protein YiiM
MAQIVSVNVGLPREVEWRGRTVSTGIFKEPVEGRVRLRELNLEGDGQADLTVHGGPAKAVYLYPAEHYPYWQTELARDLPWGMFGENLTADGLLEDEVNIGDRFRIGATELVVTQPRMPCFKLGIRFERPAIVKRCLASGRTGWYFSVAAEGDIAAGDEIERTGTDERGLTVADVAGLFVGEGGEEMLHLAVDHDGLPDGWRDYFRQRIA